jgi:hypothetical protein
MLTEWSFMPRFLSLLDRAKEKLKDEKPGSGFSREGSLLLLDVSPLIVVGDLHGDLNALETIMKEGRIKERLRSGWRAVFLGDYADRGPDPLGVYGAIFELKLSNPDGVFLLKGNHEGTEVVKFHPHDLPWHVRSNYPDEYEEVYRSLLELHSLLPLAAIVDSWLLFMHGGVMLGMTRKTLSDPSQEELKLMLWSDPYEQSERTSASPRGVGVRFGPEVSKEALREIGVRHLVRSHSVVPAGYRFNHQGMVLTVFSAKNVYALERGAYLELEPFENLESGIRLF